MNEEALAQWGAVAPKERKNNVIYCWGDLTTRLYVILYAVLQSISNID
jgi:hypothetical protein